MNQITEFFGVECLDDSDFLSYFDNEFDMKYWLIDGFWSRFHSKADTYAQRLEIERLCIDI